MKLLKSLTMLLVILFAVSMITGCSEDDDDPVSPTMVDYFEDITELGAAYFGGGTKNITSDNLFAELTAGDELFLIDYRSATHFNDAGYIDLSAIATANATLVNWPIADLMDNLADIPAGVKVVNVCYTGQTASQATSALRLLGYDAWNLKWGMCGWTGDEDVNLEKWSGVEAGGWDLYTEAFNSDETFDLPTVELEESDVATAIETLLDAYFEAGTKNMESSVLFDNLADGNDTNDPFIINYWPPLYYNAGHIDGAIMWNSSTDTPEYKSFDISVLNELPTDREIVVYCWTGQTSSQIASYLNILGYNAYSLKFGINGIQSHDVMPELYKDGTWYHAPDNNYPTTTGG